MEHQKSIENCQRWSENLNKNVSTLFTKVKDQHLDTMLFQAVCSKRGGVGDELGGGEESGGGGDEKGQEHLFPYFSLLFICWKRFCPHMPVLQHKWRKLFCMLINGPFLAPQVLLRQSKGYTVYTIQSHFSGPESIKPYCSGGSVSSERSLCNSQGNATCMHLSWHFLSQVEKMKVDLEKERRRRAMGVISLNLSLFIKMLNF